MVTITNPVGSNIPELSVSDLSGALKRTVEEAFGRVRVRGELSKVAFPASGHMYTALKDAGAVMDAVCWRGTLPRLAVRPEEGLEVICTGRITTYPARSSYQLVIEQMELAGIGALLKMIEDRRVKLAAEGLFDTARKRPLPILPRTIGVITSPTGAVIRDILHRLADRFPVHVLVWPVAVQGDNAASEITAAINGMNAIPLNGSMPRPDVLIVARGGGSVEDLMPFNDESVIRAAATSTIPLISAVGHETDTTLIDYASDRRAPTPTAAAEFAVPVRGDLMFTVDQTAGQLATNMRRILRDHRAQLDTLTAKLGTPDRVLETPIQRLDYAEETLRRVTTARFDKLSARLDHAAARIRHPSQIVGEWTRILNIHHTALARAGGRVLDPPTKRLDQTGRLLETLSFQATLKRGFTLVRDKDGYIIRTGATLAKNQDIQITFGDETTRTATVN
jgi:exodeoxyribonuclease VII large subunit